VYIRTTGIVVDRAVIVYLGHGKNFAADDDDDEQQQCRQSYCILPQTYTNAEDQLNSMERGIYNYLNFANDIWTQVFHNGSLNTQSSHNAVTVFTSPRVLSFACTCGAISESDTAPATATDTSHRLQRRANNNTPIMPA
jgi:hypothetical protein